MSLTFQLDDAESGSFVYPAGLYDSLLAEFDDLLEGHEQGLIGDKAYLSALERLLAKAPDFLDVHSHIALHWHEEGKPKKALDAALRGLDIANRHIPEGFRGRIEWAILDNRPYLRTLHFALLSYMRLRRHKDAMKIIELMLDRNPNDNQGVRYLLGSEALRAGDFARALTALNAEANDYPPYFYELALCHMMRGEWIAAATALRRGFAANPYIAEFLGGNASPAPLAIWHDSNFAGPDVVDEYIRMYGALWHTQPDSLFFVRWLFNHSKVLVERAGIMECKEALNWEHDGNARVKLTHRQRVLEGKIDDQLSAAIVVKRQNPRGEMVWPWSHE